MTASFIHLRLHTEFSLVDSVVRIKPLVQKLVDMGMPACAVTDQCNFFGLIKFYNAAQGAGVKPIAGCDFWVNAPDAEDSPTLLTLLAMNEAGYKSITDLISRAYQHGQRQGVPYVNREWVSEHGEGTIVLSGGKLGDVGVALVGARDIDAKESLEQWMRDFPGRFYLELQRTGRANDEDYLHKAVALAADLQCPVVATNDVRFIGADDFEIHEARVCIGEGLSLIHI